MEWWSNHVLLGILGDARDPIFVVSLGIGLAKSDWFASTRLPESWFRQVIQVRSKEIECKRLRTGDHIPQKYSPRPIEPHRPVAI